MGGFLLGAGCAVLIAAVTYLGLVELGVSTADRMADNAVKFDRGVDYDSAMHDASVGPGD